MSENTENLRDLANNLLMEEVVSFRPDLARVFGGIRNALMLSQALYWTANAAAKKRGGWFYKSAREWEEETAMTRGEQRRARGELAEAGVFNTELRGSPPTTWYRVDLDLVRSAMVHFRKSGKALIDRNHCPNQRSTRSGRLLKRRGSNCPAAGKSIDLRQAN
jgi:hypothetical protein